jgi:hypothetical protein
VYDVYGHLLDLKNFVVVEVVDQNHLLLVEDLKKINDQ